MKLKEIKQRNQVARHMHGMSGAGPHEQKRGKKHVKRAKQKHDFRRQLKNIEY